MRLQGDVVRDDQLYWVEMKVDPETGMEWQEPEKESIDPDVKGIVTKSEILRFGLRRLRTVDSNAIDESGFHVSIKSKDGTAVGVDSEFDYSATKMTKLVCAIFKWEGIEDANGQEVEPSHDTILQLPPWITNHLLDVINERNNLSVELAGE